MLLFLEKLWWDIEIVKGDSIIESSVRHYGIARQQWSR